MDFEDLLLFFGFLCLIATPFLLVPAIMGCVAWGNTRAWQKAKAQRQHDAESQKKPLLQNEKVEEDGEPEFLDSEDEAEYRAQQVEEAEAEADWQLTTNEKFKREWKKCWVGNADRVKKEQEKKEREERRKMAREVVRQMMRYQRKSNHGDSKLWTEDKKD